MKNRIVLDKNQGKITFNEYEIQMHNEGGILYFCKNQIGDITHDTAPRGKWRWFGLSVEQILCSELPNITGAQTIMFSFLAGIYEMYIRCQDNKMLDCIIGHITNEIQKRSYGEDFLSHIKVENLYKMDAEQILLFAKMGTLWLLKEGSPAELTALRLFSDIKSLKII